MRPKVLYIVGYGRSGSTVLGMALGRHPAVFNGGELIGLPTFLEGPHYCPPRACGCLERVEACPFWRQVAQRVPLTTEMTVPTGGGVATLRPLAAAN